MAVTIYDVAEASGYSAKTVSKVLNGADSVRSDTRDRVMRAVTELGYRPNMSARSLRSGKSGVIGLAVPALRLAFFGELADMIISEARARRVSVVVEQTSPQSSPNLAVAESRMAVSDGVIYSPILEGTLIVQDYDAHLPVVSLDETSGPDVDAVSIDNVGVTRAATEHLISLGRRRIALIGADPLTNHQPVSRLRLQGYLDALQEAGLEYDPDLLAGGEGGWGREGGADAFERLVDAKVSFDGVVAMTDGLALGALRAAARRGVRVPEDVAVIGVDDIEDSRFSTPSLSSVEPGKAELARLSVDLLISKIRGEPVTPGVRYTRFRVIQRESTAIPRP